jgi:hypothetical protein
LFGVVKGTDTVSVKMICRFLLRGAQRPGS